jgi:hypothetical protein
LNATFEDSEDEEGFHNDEKLHGGESMKSEVVGDNNHNDNDTYSETKPEESYKDAIRRLQCDKPWFWNAFKCLWLDIKARNYQERTKTNAITVAWMLGPPILILLWVVCGFIRNLVQNMKVIKRKRVFGNVVCI